MDETLVTLLLLKLLNDTGYTSEVFLIAIEGLEEYRPDKQLLTIGTLTFMVMFLTLRGSCVPKHFKCAVGFHTCLCQVH